MKKIVIFSDEREPYAVQYLDASSCSIKENILVQSLSVSASSVRQSMLEGFKPISRLATLFSRREAKTSKSKLFSDTNLPSGK